MGGDRQMVYLVTSGEYSDYGVRAVCSSEDKARETIAKLASESGSPADDFEVEPWALDEVLEHEVGPVFNVAITLEDGAAVLHKDGVPVYGPDQTGGRLLRHPQRAEVHRVGPDDWMVLQYQWPVQVRVSSPISYKHALKLAGEERQAWLRERSSS